MVALLLLLLLLLFLPLLPLLLLLAWCAPQSTFCKMMQEHGAATHRSIKVANMDPAAEEFKYKVDFGASPPAPPPPPPPLRVCARRAC